MEEIRALIARRHQDLDFNSAQETASMYFFPENSPLYPPIRDSKTIYVAISTLDQLALASDDILWEIFGSVISMWPAGVQLRTVAECKADESAWVAKYRTETQASVQAQVLDKIRKALAEAELFLVPSTDLDVFTKIHGEKGKSSESESEDEKEEEDNEGEFDHTLAMHRRHSDCFDRIYIFSTIPVTENLLISKIISSVYGIDPGFGLDVLLVATAKAVVHEARYLVASTLHGDQYRNPLLMQGSFNPSDHASKSYFAAGEAGTRWYEVSRYGSFIAPMLVSTLNPPTLASSTLELVGHIGRGPLRAAFASTVQAQADRIRAGTFIVPQRFFNQNLPPLSSNSPSG
ncbi:hypothetical protein DFH06DRAFT_604886 [Mycena polygramma]|nr:hypothetical protein DFH06DRAFT_604886 [Mycena polygramma]